MIPHSWKSGDGIGYWSPKSGLWRKSKWKEDKKAGGRESERRRRRRGRKRNGKRQEKKERAGEAGGGRTGREGRGSFLVTSEQKYT